MPHFIGPSKETPSYYTRFIRVEKRIYVPDPPDDTTTHARLAMIDKLHQRIEKLKGTKPEALDAGFIFHSNRSTGNELFLDGNSSTMELPVNSVREKAREITNSLIARLSPECVVTDHL